MIQGGQTISANSDTGFTPDVRQKLTERLGFDPVQMRQKYAEERDKRLRPEAAQQFARMEERIEAFADDPHVKSGSARPALSDEVDVVVVGGGMTGLLAAVRLREAGVERIRVIEAGADFGGTWYWNDYPGIRCDVESYIYMPLLEELGYTPSERYATGPEILQHCKAIAKKFDLYEDACFHTHVSAMRWDQQLARWIVQTNRDDAIRAQFVVLAIGGLHRGRLPQVEGIEEFEGRVFHTSRWDYEYTGGDAYGALERLADKRVGLVGTGATGVQVVPHLGEWAKELYVFQRTPASVDVRANRPTDDAWAAALPPGWQRERMENFNLLTSGYPVEGDLVADGWTENFSRVLFGARADKFADLDLSPAQLAEVADFEKMAEIRDRVKTIVKDPETAQSLMPYFRQFCKRPCFHDEYLETFNRPNVHLVDTMGRGVERLTRHGAVANGQEYELDCLVFATGFETTVRAPRYTGQGGFEVYGREGVKLSDKWADGARSLHGQHVNGFPNLLIMSPIQSTYAANWHYVVEGQAAHVAYVIGEARARGARVLEAKESAEQDWISRVIANSAVQREFLEACTPGYLNGEGKLSDTVIVDGAYGGSNVLYFDELARWRAEGRLEGLQLQRDGGS